MSKRIRGRERERERIGKCLRWHFWSNLDPKRKLRVGNKRISRKERKREKEKKTIMKERCGTEKKNCAYISEKKVKLSEEGKNS